MRASGGNNTLCRAHYNERQRSKFATGLTQASWRLKNFIIQRLTPLQLCPPPAQDGHSGVDKPRHTRLELVVVGWLSGEVRRPDPTGWDWDCLDQALMG